VTEPIRSVSLGAGRLEFGETYATYEQAKDRMRLAVASIAEHYPGSTWEAGPEVKRGPVTDYRRTDEPKWGWYGVLRLPVLEQPEGPEDGHTFRISVTSRGSYAVWPEGDPEPGPHSDAEEFMGPGFTLDVRAWNLQDAMAKAAQVPLGGWSMVGHEGTPLSEMEPG
jgi:hypothetical protein